MITPIIREWIDALRSGRYPQTRGRLHNPNFVGYCCLGVACEIAVKHGIINPAKIFDSAYGGITTINASYGVTGDFSESNLPGVVRDWFGFESTSGFNFKVKCREYSDHDVEDEYGEQLPCGVGDEYGYGLDELNDEGLTFDQIADVIEWYFTEPSADGEDRPVTGLTDGAENLDAA